MDENILNEVSSHGFEKSFTRQCLETNKHNGATTTYYLIVKKKSEEGFHSYADMNSNNFDATLLEPHTSIEKVKKSNSSHQHHKSSIDRLL